MPYFQHQFYANVIEAIRGDFRCCLGYAAIIGSRGCYEKVVKCVLFVENTYGVEAAQKILQ